MGKRGQKISVITLGLLISGIIIFICGFCLFVIKTRDSSVYIYSILMCVSGLAFILTAMVRDIGSRSKREGAKAKAQNSKKQSTKKRAGK